MRSNIFKQSDQNGTTVNGSKKNGSQKKQNGFTVYKNSISVGKVADKFERKSELSQDVVQFKRGLSPANQNNCSKSLDENKNVRSSTQMKTNDSNESKHGPDVLSRGPRSSFSTIVEDRIRKLEKGEDSKKLDSTASKSSPDLQSFKHDRSVMPSKFTVQKLGHELSSELEVQNNVAEKVSEDRGLERYHDISLEEKDVDAVAATNRNITIDHEDERNEEVRQNKEERAFIEEDPCGRIEMEDKDLFMTQDSMELQEDKNYQHVTREY